MAPLQSCARPTCRFHTFLDAIEAGEPLGPEAFHAFPQAFKVNVVTRAPRRFDAVVKLEALDEGLRGVQRLALRRHGRNASESQRRARPRKGSLSGIQVNRAGNTQCGQVDLSDPELLHRLCVLYRPDFVCFDYPLPAACANLSWAQPLPRPPSGWAACRAAP